MNLLFTSVLVTFIAAASINLILAQTLSDIWQLHLLDTEQYPLAQCLDGSQGGFWLSPGFGDGKNKFIIHHQGGGWCINLSDCYSRSKKYLGSSVTWEKFPNCTNGSSAQPCKTDEGDHGLLSRDPRINPLTYNWNRLYIGYCDGGSYAGEVANAVPVDGETVVYFRGRYILDAVYETFLSSPDVSMPSAKEIIISGTSAGGLAVYIHIDYLVKKINKAFKSLNLTPARIVAVPDAGYFMDIPSINGSVLYTQNYKNIFAMQNVVNSVDDDCRDHYDGSDEIWKCFMAPYALPFIETPMFIVNSMVDSWQGTNIMGLTCNPTVSDNCDNQTFQYLEYFRDQMIHHSSLSNFLSKEGTGAWLVECYVHCLLDNDHYFGEVAVESATMMKTLSNWYHNVRSSKWIAVDGTWGTNDC